MARYVLKRIVAAIPVLLVVSVLTFLIPHVSAGDPARTILGPDASQADVDRMRNDMGLNDPLIIQYTGYLAGVVTGDLGESAVHRRAVSTLIAERLPLTLTLALGALLLGIVVALPLGVVAALNHGRFADFGTMLVALVGVSTPPFAVGLLLIYLFAYRWGILPSAGLPSFADEGLSSLRHLVLPIATLALSSVALSARLLRSGMLEVLNQDYVRTARAKGAGIWTVVRTHCLKNALIPIVTVLGLQLGTLIGGAVVTETVFALPGVGRLAVDAIAARDFAIVQGVVLIVAIAIVVINLLTDLLYRWLDPRISLR